MRAGRGEINLNGQNLINLIMCSNLTFTLVVIGRDPRNITFSAPYHNYFLYSISLLFSYSRPMSLISFSYHCYYLFTLAISLLILIWIHVSAIFLCHINVTHVFYSHTTLTVSHKCNQMSNVRNDMAGNRI